MRSAAALILAPFLAGCTAVKSGANPVSVPIVARAASPEATRARPEDVRALEASLRSLLLKNLPTPLVKSEHNWGKQRPALVRKNEMRNDGTWRRFSVKPVNPQHSLGLGIEDALFPEPGRSTFTAKIGLDCDLQFEQQIWKNVSVRRTGEARNRPASVQLAGTVQRCGMKGVRSSDVALGRRARTSRR